MRHFAQRTSVFVVDEEEASMASCGWATLAALTCLGKVPGANKVHECQTQGSPVCTS